MENENRYLELEAVKAKFSQLSERKLEDIAHEVGIKGLIRHDYIWYSKLGANKGILIPHFKQYGLSIFKDSGRAIC